jgi:hypothetical protein
VRLRAGGGEGQRCFGRQAVVEGEKVKGVLGGRQWLVYEPWRSPHCAAASLQDRLKPCGGNYMHASRWHSAADDCSARQGEKHAKIGMRAAEERATHLSRSSSGEMRTRSPLVQRRAAMASTLTHAAPPPLAARLAAAAKTEFRSEESAADSGGWGKPPQNQTP